MNNAIKGVPIQLLLVEDSPGDVRLTRETLKDSKLLIDLNVVRDGVEAMAYLRREGQYANSTCPDLILLDLNLPRKDGREVLAEIKGDPQLKHIPVVVLTVSSAEEDILKSYNLHANAYICKPVSFEQFGKIARAIDDFWFTIVKLPSRGNELNGQKL